MSMEVPQIKHNTEHCENILKKPPNMPSSEVQRQENIEQ
jgi:hypothetical protein